MPLYKGPTPQWNDINLPAFSLGKGATPPDDIGILPSGGIRALGFDGASTVEEVHSSGEVLHGYIADTDLDIHIHWMPTDTNTGTVKWQLEYYWINAGGTYGAPTIITSTQEAGGTAWKAWHSHFPAIDGTGKVQGSEIVFRFFRDPSEDTYGSDAALVQIGIHYQVNTLGSRQVETK